MGQITIQSFTLPADNLADGTYTLRSWYNQGYLTNTGEAIAPGTSTTGTQLRSVATVAAGFITFSPYNVYSTLDAESPNPRAIGIACQLFKGNTGLPIYPFQQLGTPTFWVVPNDLGSTISFEEWTIVNQASQLYYWQPNWYTAAQVDALIRANNTQVAFNQDYVITAYASLAAAVTAAAITDGTLVINEATACPDNLTVPANVTLRFTRKGSITISAAKTLTLLSVPEAGPYQIFFNAKSDESGTVSFSGNTALTSICPEWWGENTIPGTTSMTTTIQAALNSLVRGGIVQLQATTYLTGQLEIAAAGTTLQGMGTHPQSGTKTTLLDFTGLPNNDSGILSDGFYGVVLRNFFMSLPNGTGGAGIKMFASGDSLIENIVIGITRGSTAFGVQLGDRNLLSNANAVIVTTVRQVRVAGLCDANFFIGTGSTSIHFDNCYATSPQTSGFEFFHATYSAATACAVDGNPDVAAAAYGYLVEAATGITLTACGAESCWEGHTRITGGATGVTMIGCRGVGNNLIGNGAIGRFLQIDTGGNYNNSVIGGTDTPDLSSPQGIAANAATNFSIFGDTGTLYTNLIGYNATSFPKGFGGSTAFKQSFLSLVSGGELMTGGLVAGITGAGGGGILAAQPKTNDVWASGITIGTGTSGHVIAASFTTSGTSTFSTDGVGAYVGQFLYITTVADASGSVVVTFSSSNFRSSGTQTTTASHWSTIVFQTDGVKWNEVSRTTNLA